MGKLAVVIVIYSGGGVMLFGCGMVVFLSYPSFSLPLTPYPL